MLLFRRSFALRGLTVVVSRCIQGAKGILRALAGCFRTGKGNGVIVRLQAYRMSLPSMVPTSRGLVLVRTCCAMVYVRHRVACLISGGMHGPLRRCLSRLARHVHAVQSLAQSLLITIIQLALLPPGETPACCTVLLVFTRTVALCTIDYRAAQVR